MKKMHELVSSHVKMSLDFYKRGNAQKGRWAHLAALFLLFLEFEFFSFGPPLETMKKKVVLAQIWAHGSNGLEKISLCWEFR